MICIAEAKEPVSTDEVYLQNTNYIDLAYREYSYYKKVFNDIEYTCIPTEIMDAKLWMLDYWFMPHPGENRFNDTLFDFEVRIEHLNIELHDTKSRLRGRNKKIAIAGVLGFVAGGVSVLLLKN